MDVFGIFEGGGAKGLAHVGALKASEERGLTFKALAGASAGALVAGLSAAGFAADELYDPRNGRGVLAIHPALVFGAEDWEIIAHARADLESLRKASAMGFWLRLPRLWWTYRRALANKGGIGILNSGRFVEWLNGHLARKLGLGRPPRFDDLARPLKVIATNIDTGDAHIFGPAETPETPLAEAIAASLAIPYVLSPIASGTSHLVDGGVVSNFPVWLLDRERFEAGPATPTFGFSLTGTPMTGEAGPPRTLIDFTEGLVRAALFGGGYLELRGVENFHRVVMPVRTGALDLDMGPSERHRVYTQGRDSAHQFFRTCIGPRPADEMRLALGVICDHIRTALAARFGQTVSHLRAGLMAPVSEFGLRNLYAAGMEEDGDDRLLIRQGSGGPGLAFTNRDIVLTDMQVALARAGSHFALDKYLCALIRPSLRTLLSLPLFADDGQWALAPPARSAPIAVLNIDSDEDLLAPFADPSMAEPLAAIAQFTARQLRG
ncbi:MAG: patatin-like phospholipase family protein [Alphaproteobacteria bacterium]|nr:patatin-like phospholipase family protein [Alphaproteobacteria bacterium]